MAALPLTASSASVVTERHGRPGAMAVVLLHAGVADRRSWHGVIDALHGDDLDLIAYDRRGYGDTPGTAAAFTHLGDLLDVLDAASIGSAVLVGNSMGGALALDIALAHPDRVASLLLIGAAVSGMTDDGEGIDWTPDEATAAILASLVAAEEEHAIDEQVRLELHLWLDGPANTEGRVGGAPRALAAAMNRRILEAGTDGHAGGSGLDTWHRLAEIATPVLATWGAADLPPDEPFYRITAARLPNAVARVLPGVAHLPSLEQPGMVAGLVREAVAMAAARTAQSE